MASDYPCDTFARTTYHATWVYIQSADGSYLRSCGWRGEDPQWSSLEGLLLSWEDAQRIDAGLTLAGIVTTWVAGDPGGRGTAGPPVMIWRDGRLDRRAAAMGGNGH